MAFELIQKNYNLNQLNIIDMSLFLESPFLSDLVTLIIESDVVFLPDAPTVSPGSTGKPDGSHICICIRLLRFRFGNVLLKLVIN
jgi:hypothetical protein